ncbi:hypothetical protein GDO78_015696 [Eleutherodactylus coqui]|uniref:TIL domain-containing protein n=1 Tax=Eleutherodactylus coqui TaxID=57060 RepID=A0A8J6EDD2_ELECQ|nr:hypothetical protein GDO78_015696 [Eleutherodactylus coqui]
MLMNILTETTACNEATPTESCLKNQTYTYCGTMCPKVCNVPQRDVCSKGYFIGCKCDDGYEFVNKSQLSCVLPADCP